MPKSDSKSESTVTASLIFDLCLQYPCRLTVLHDINVSCKLLFYEKSGPKKNCGHVFLGPSHHAKVDQAPMSLKVFDDSILRIIHIYEFVNLTISQL